MVFILVNRVASVPVFSSHTSPYCCLMASSRFPVFLASYLFILYIFLIIQKNMPIFINFFVDFLKIVLNGISKRDVTKIPFTSLSIGIYFYNVFITDFYIFVLFSKNLPLFPKCQKRTIFPGHVTRFLWL